MKLLIDTTVLIDYFVRRQPFVKDWMSLRIAAAFGDVELWASAKSFTDIFYVVGKAVDPEDLQKAFLESLSFLDICSIEKSDIQNAAELSWHDFEDCLIHIAAKKVKADFIITRDAQGFQGSKIPTKTVEEIIGVLQEDYGLDFKEISPPLSPESSKK